MYLLYLLVCTEVLHCLAGYGTRTVSTTRLQHSNHDALSGDSDPKKPSYLHYENKFTELCNLVSGSKNVVV